MSFLFPSLSTSWLNFYPPNPNRIAVQLPQDPFKAHPPPSTAFEKTAYPVTLLDPSDRPLPPIPALMQSTFTPPQALTPPVRTSSLQHHLQYLNSSNSTTPTKPRAALAASPSTLQLHLPHARHVVPSDPLASPSPVSRLNLNPAFPSPVPCRGVITTPLSELHERPTRPKRPEPWLLPLTPSLGTYVERGWAEEYPPNSGKYRLTTRGEAAVPPSPERVRSRRKSSSRSSSAPMEVPQPPEACHARTRNPRRAPMGILAPVDLNVQRGTGANASGTGKEHKSALPKPDPTGTKGKYTWPEWV